MLVRLQKYMADCGIASRRKCEEMISAGRVSVNGAVVCEQGVKVSDSDEVAVDGKFIRCGGKKIYIMMNKPARVLTASSDDRGRTTVIDLVKDEISARIFPVGRLDYDTEGLLLLTNDGDLAYGLTHPKSNVYKTYKTVLNDVPSPSDVEKLKTGIYIDGKKTYPAKVEWHKDSTLLISIHEGRNRQIRKMCEALGYKVKYLQRISVGNIKLGNVPLGRWRHLNNGEIDYLKKICKC